MRDLPIVDRQVPGPGQAGLAARTRPRAHPQDGRPAPTSQVTEASKCVILLICINN